MFFRSTPVSMRDLARQLGVSQTTVSLALKDHPRISANMRSKVQALAKEMGYVPDPLVSQMGALRGKNTSGVLRSTLALILPNRLPAQLHSGAWWPNSELWEAFHGHAAAHGYAADLFSLSDYSTLDRLVSVLYNRAVRGVGITQIRDPQLANLTWFPGLAVVEINFGFVPTSYHKVQFDRFGEVGTAVEKALEAGFTRIALVLLDEPDALDRSLRMASYAHHLSVAGKEQLPIFDAKVRLPREAGEVQAKAEAVRLKQFLRKHEVEVVIALNGWVGHLLHLAKVQVPGEVSYIDLATQPGDFRTGLFEDFRALGRVTIDTLDPLIRTGQGGAATEPRTVILRKKWIDGETLARAHPVTDVNARLGSVASPPSRRKGARQTHPS